jgi:predicted short-subunit dehydrogenase-like oxidoreductase (DUF2520 family)
MAADPSAIKIVCIGAGRLAHQLMPQLEDAGGRVLEIYNRTLFGATSLARVFSAAAIQTEITKIHPGADLYFITVSDDAIADVCSQLSYLENDHSIFVHSSGIQPLDILPFKRRGIFYPLQTFSHEHQVDWRNTPLLITAETNEIEHRLMALAKSISDLVYSISDKEKAVLHLGAVFANNFVNHMLTLSEHICKEHGVSFEILKPIIRETIEKALDVGPSKSQTGPAIRGDQHTIEKHMKMLAEDQNQAEVYRVITESIMRFNKGM